MKNNQRCTRCVNDKTIKKIYFDEQGVCEFCTTYDQYEAKLHDYKNLEELFLRKIKNEGHKYDVALGFSGGKDSTYVLYHLINTYHLKVITYTLDNGFLSQEAKNKINRLVKEFNVAHEYVECDQELLKKTYRYITKKYLSPCIACSYLGYAVMINYASKVDAAVGIHGRSIYQMLRNFSSNRDDVFKPFVLEGLKEPSECDFEKLYQSSIGQISNLIDKKLAKEIESQLLGDAKKIGYRDFIAYFLYHPYDQKEIVDFLTANTSWRVESEEEHFDCLIHHGALYLKNIIARRSHLMPEFSVMIKEKKMTKDQALKLLSFNKTPEAKEELKMLCRFCKINYSTLMLKAHIYAKRWW